MYGVLKQFDQSTKIAALAERSVAFAAAGRGAEAQLITDLAVELKNREEWDDDTITNVLGGLSETYQTDPEKADPAKAQAVGAFSAQMLNGLVYVAFCTRHPIKLTKSFWYALNEQYNPTDFYDSSKGFGLIIDALDSERYFVHVSGTTEDIAEGDKVSFELERGQKGLNAVRVKKI